MCMFSSPKIQAPPPPPVLEPRPKDTEGVPKEAPKPPKRSNPEVVTAERDSRKKIRNLRGDQSTKLTGPRGIMAPINTGKATLG